jgi:Tol biopolymer transport system component
VDCLLSFEPPTLVTPGSIALSPDGKTIAIDVKTSRTSFIYLVPADTGIALRLTNAKAGKEGSPAFSADGKRVAFTYWLGEGARSRIQKVPAGRLNSVGSYYLPSCRFRAHQRI